MRPLHAAAEHGSPEVVAELARRVHDVDAEQEGRTALWEAVFNNRPDNARALVAAGADPWRPMMNGWSPGRLSLATPTPALFAVPDGEAGLSAVEAARRLEAVPAEDVDIEDLMDDPWADEDESLAVVGVTDGPGGCVVVQPWGYSAANPGVIERLSAGTVCYALFANPKSGNQGAVARGGAIEEWDTHPGGGSVSTDEPAEEILTTYLYHGEAVAYCYAGAGLRPTGPRSITDQAGMWLRLPEHLL